MAGNADLLDQIRQIVREEVEAEAKTVNDRAKVNSIKVEAALITVNQQLKDLQISNTRLEKGQQSLQAGQKDLKDGQNTLERKVENFHAEQKKANTEILLTLQDIAEINAKDADERLERIEKHLNLPPVK